jgi:hypothetical protein
MVEEPGSLWTTDNLHSIDASLRTLVASAGAYDKNSSAIVSDCRKGWRRKRWRYSMRL